MRDTGRLHRSIARVAAGAFCAALLALTASAAWTGRQGTQTQPNLSVEQAQHGARGFGADSARVDSQITLRIPDGQADQVYEYLKDKYVGKSDFLSDRFPTGHLRGQDMSDSSVFTDVYYDTPTLALHANKNSCRHRTRVNTTHPEDRKSGRSLVQMKVTPPGDFTLRSELKYEVEADPQDRERHPLLRLISRKLRDDFRRVYSDAGLDPYSLEHVFTITQTRRRGYVNWDATNIFSFSVDEGSARVLWAKGSFASVDLGLVEIAYTEGDEARRKLMWELRDAVIADLRARFPALEQNSDSKYSLVLEQILAKLPMLPWILRSGLSPNQAAVAVLLALVAAAASIVVVLRRRRATRELAARFEREAQARAKAGP